MTRLNGRIKQEIVIIQDTKRSKPHNRLIHQKSPYLLQHAGNPVDWYCWGEEAFEKARREQKLIFLSSGYSTCHWCHVMARESFENDEIAAILNRSFVPVKLDREERPDIDRVYMTYVQATTGNGGWPMSVWLTPDLKPLLGGTYFPPETKWGCAGFKTVLTRIAAAWASDRDQLTAAASDALDRLRTAVSAEPDAPMAPESQWIEDGVAQIKASYDSRYGGFGGAPKFPCPSLPDFLLRCHARECRDATKKNGRLPEGVAMVLHTLRAMVEGGLFDHLGGGFHRYSVDERWHVPHFEKMLYDQAQLVCTYLDAYQITHDPLFARVARQTLDYVRHAMTGPEGRFYSAEDADSDMPGRPGEHAEGAFYVWEHAELLERLGEQDGDVFCFHYGVEEHGNVRDDPHGEFVEKNVLFVAHSIEETARRFAQPPDEVRRTLAAARATLLAARATRPRPHLDDKTITAWNGLMISAFARAAQALGDVHWLSAAQDAAAFLHAQLYAAATETLYRRYRDGQAAFDGYAEDYAFLIRGLLDLYEAAFDSRHLEWAMALQKTQDRLFWDAERGGYFATGGTDASVLLRMKDDHDGAEPSANSVSALNLLRLARMTGLSHYANRASETLTAFAGRLARTPHAMPAMLTALAFHREPPLQIVIAGVAEAADTQALLRAVHTHYWPHKVLLFADRVDDQPGLHRQTLSFVAGCQPVNGEASAMICENGVCHPPVTDPAKLAQF